MSVAQIGSNSNSKMLPSGARQTGPQEAGAGQALGQFQLAAGAQNEQELKFQPSGGQQQVQQQKQQQSAQQQQQQQQQQSAQQQAIEQQSAQQQDQTTQQQQQQQLLGPDGKPKRNPYCSRCRNHGKSAQVKGHKRHCEYRDCQCEGCKLVEMRQIVSAAQIKRRRYQKQDEECGRSIEVSPPVLTRTPSSDPTALIAKTLIGSAAGRGSSGGAKQLVAAVAANQLHPGQHGHFQQAGPAANAAAAAAQAQAQAHFGPHLNAGQPAGPQMRLQQAPSQRPQPPGQHSFGLGLGAGHSQHQEVGGAHFGLPGIQSAAATFAAAAAAAAAAASSASSSASSSTSTCTSSGSSASSTASSSSSSGGSVGGAGVCGAGPPPSGGLGAVSSASALLGSHAPLHAGPGSLTPLGAPNGPLLRDHHPHQQVGVGGPRAQPSPMSAADQPNLQAALLSLAVNLDHHLASQNGGIAGGPNAINSHLQHLDLEELQRMFHFPAGVLSALEASGAGGPAGLSAANSLVHQHPHAHPHHHQLGVAAHPANPLYVATSLAAGAPGASANSSSLPSSSNQAAGPTGGEAAATSALMAAAAAAVSGMGANLPGPREQFLLVDDIHQTYGSLAVYAWLRSERFNHNKLRSIIEMSKEAFDDLLQLNGHSPLDLTSPIVDQ